MKKLILFLFLIPSLLMGQSKFADSGSGFVTSANNPLTGGHGSGYISVKITNPATDNLFASTKITHIKEPKLIYAPLPASTAITITITDNSTATLVDIRDTLCSFWGYPGDPNDSAAKLAFLKQFLVNKIKNDYAQMKGASSAQLTLTIVNVQ